MSASRSAATALLALTIAASGFQSNRLLAQTQTPAPAAPSPAPVASAPAQAPAPAAAPTESGFETRILAGGAVNMLMLVDVQPVDLVRLPRGTVRWAQCATTSQPLQARSKTSNAVRANNAPVGTELSVRIPPPPCTRAFLGFRLPWPVYQDAYIQIETAEQSSAPARALFEGTVPVSVRWFPLLITFVLLALIYPGCALVSFYLARRRYQKLPELARKAEDAPRFFDQLDPVQITSNAYGRGSLPKFQTFAFSFIVFGLLLYYQFRNGILSGLSEDVLFLLGISAVGTVGGRITYAAKRRLSLDSWVWLRRQKWMMFPDARVEMRAKWRDLVVDADNNEFDPYGFQMAIFSVVVAIALLSTSLIGLSSFEIPAELLGLLGLSQAVFIGGKAAESSPYNELDQKITEVRKHEREYQSARAEAESATDPKAKADAEARADATRAAFKSEVAQAADMFVAIFKMEPPSSSALSKPGELEPECPLPLMASSGTP